MASGNSIDSDGEGHLVPEEGSGGNMEDGSVGQNNLPYLTCEEHQVLKSLGGHVAAKHMKSVREGKERPRLIGHAIRSDLLDGINDFVSKGCMKFSSFRGVWLTRKLSIIHYAAPRKVSERRYLELAFAMAFDLILKDEAPVAAKEGTPPTSGNGSAGGGGAEASAPARPTFSLHEIGPGSLPFQIGALFSLYSLHGTQLFRPPLPIRTSAHEMVALIFLRRRLKAAGPLASDALAVLARLAIGGVGNGGSGSEGGGGGVLQPAAYPGPGRITFVESIVPFTKGKVRKKRDLEGERRRAAAAVMAARARAAGARTARARAGGASREVRDGAAPAVVQTASSRVAGLSSVYKEYAAALGSARPAGRRTSGSGSGSDNDRDSDGNESGGEGIPVADRSVKFRRDLADILERGGRDKPPPPEAYGLERLARHPPPPVAVAVAPPVPQIVPLSSRLLELPELPPPMGPVTMPAKKFPDAPHAPRDPTSGGREQARVGRGDGGDSRRVGQVGVRDHLKLVAKSLEEAEESNGGHDGGRGEDEARQQGAGLRQNDGRAAGRVRLPGGLENTPSLPDGGGRTGGGPDLLRSDDRLSETDDDASESSPGPPVRGKRKQAAAQPIRKNGGGGSSKRARAQGTVKQTPAAAAAATGGSGKVQKKGKTKERRRRGTSGDNAPSDSDGNSDEWDGLADMRAFAEAAAGWGKADGANADTGGRRGGKVAAAGGSLSGNDDETNADSAATATATAAAARRKGAPRKQPRSAPVQRGRGTTVKEGHDSGGSEDTSPPARSLPACKGRGVRSRYTRPNAKAVDASTAAEENAAESDARRRLAPSTTPRSGTRPRTAPEAEPAAGDESPRAKKARASIAISSSGAKEAASGGSAASKRGRAAAAAAGRGGARDRGEQGVAGRGRGRGRGRGGARVGTAAAAAAEKEEEVATAVAREDRSAEDGEGNGKATAGDDQEDKDDDDPNVSDLVRFAAEMASSLSPLAAPAAPRENCSSSASSDRRADGGEKKAKSARGAAFSRPSVGGVAKPASTKSANPRKKKATSFWAPRGGDRAPAPPTPPTRAPAARAAPAKANPPAAAASPTEEETTARVSAMEATTTPAPAMAESDGPGGDGGAGGTAAAAGGIVDETSSDSDSDNDDDGGGGSGGGGGAARIAKGEGEGRRRLVGSGQDVSAASEGASAGKVEGMAGVAGRDRGNSPGVGGEAGGEGRVEGEVQGRAGGGGERQGVGEDEKEGRRAGEQKKDVGHDHEDLPSDTTIPGPATATTPPTNSVSTNGDVTSKAPPAGAAAGHPLGVVAASTTAAAPAPPRGGAPAPHVPEMMGDTSSDSDSGGEDDED